MFDSDLFIIEEYHVSKDSLGDSDNDGYNLELLVSGILDSVNSNIRWCSYTETDCQLNKIN